MKKPRNATPLSEQEITKLDSRLPELAGRALKNAYRRTLAAGYSVLEVANGKLVESRPDGSRREIKTVHAPIPVKLGATKTRRLPG